jgi:hypothetical protein
MKKLYALLLLAGGAFSLPVLGQSTTLINPSAEGGFELGTTFAANGWTDVQQGNNSANKWYVGSVVVNSGTRGAYISNDNNVTNAYTVNDARVQHFYRDITFPAGQSQITLTFNWKGVTESCCDYLRVHLVSTATTPAAGTLLTTGQLGVNYNMQSAWQTTTLTLPATAAGTTQRLVFSWRADGSVGTQPPHAIDNISLVSQAPPPPNCATYTSPANNATGVCNTGTTLNWNAPTSGGAPTGYKLYFGTNNPPSNIVNGTNLGNVLTYNPGTLLANTTYYWQIVPTNSAGDATGCAIQSFTTGSGCYTMTNGSTVSTCSGSFYDSGGSSGNYTNGENSTMTFCPATPGTYMQVVFSSLNLESCCDNIKVYDGTSTTAPLLGTFTGTSVPCTLTATNGAGCLTFQFYSDGSVVYSGWAATLSCSPTPGGAMPGSTCSNAITVPSLPYSATGQNTACSVNNYTNTSTGSCGTLYESGEDLVYTYTAAGPECIGITLSNASTTSIGFQVYSGCPGAAGTTCVGGFGGSNPLSGSVTLPSAGTYYIIVDTWASPSSATFDIAISSFGSGPANDLPCNAATLGLNANIGGHNTCSGSGGEPGVPSCWTTGNLNTVWYSVVCPASGQLKIRTTLGTLTNTQIALYSGTCTALTLVTGACNDNAPACGSSTYNNSEITATGLTAGATYYIRVDGTSNLTGSFDIMAVDGSIGFPPAAGQDCFIANPVCNQSISVGNPGYQAYGNNCDFTGTGLCLASGERGSVWYTIPINANGTLTFDIVPNDWPGAPSTSSTDYDFAIWKVGGSGTTTTCAGILSSPATALAACNYSGLGVTGCFGTGNAPAAYPGFDAAYEPAINVSNGDVYILVISNFSNSTSGYTLNFGSSAPINYTASPSSITWSGGTSSAWAVPSNWGGCNIPSCSVDAVISPASSTQPVISSNASVRNLTINAGASLTINAGVTLTICGDFTNNGNLIAAPTSTILFNNGSVIQNINGSLVNADKFGNLVINKTGGSVVLNQNIDIGGDLNTVNSTSILNTTGKYIKLAGHFYNSAGATTFTNVTGTLEFNGSAGQNYVAGGSNLVLNNVVMNHTGPGVTVVGNNMNIGGTLTLTLGRIITNALVVNVTNSAPAAVSTGNTASFVQGFLRRKLSSTGSFDFPVGHATQGYQRANVSFTSATTIDNLLASFNTYVTVPTALNLTECAVTYNLPALDNGRWTINAYNSSNTQISGTGNGAYTMTLYNLNYTNAASASGWTVMKDPGSGWGLDGTCSASTVGQVVRTGLSGFSNFGTAQSTAPLPIELLSFTGKGVGNRNLLEWTTASETNNDFFTVERSSNGIGFEEVTRVDGGGNSTLLLNYSTYDNSPLPEITYYRLKQTDFDGKFTYSGVIAIENEMKNITIENIYPNPTNGNINFDFITPVKGSVLVQVIDVYGKLVYEKRTEAGEGKNTMLAEMSELAQGIYTFKVIFDQGNYSSITKVVKY